MIAKLWMVVPVAPGLMHPKPPWTILVVGFVQAAFDQSPIVHVSLAATVKLKLCTAKATLLPLTGGSVRGRQNPVGVVKLSENVAAVPPQLVVEWRT